MDRHAIAEAFRQLIEGDDIPPPMSLLARMTDADASRIPEGMPYSLITNLAHAVFWQRIWLNRLDGIRTGSFVDDWKTPHPTEFGSLRSEFLSGLTRAHEIARAREFKHRMKDDTVAAQTLINILIHDAYHIGQINLIKRVVRKSKR